MQALTPDEKKVFTRLVILNVGISLADILALALLVVVIDFYAASGQGRFTGMSGWLANPQSPALVGFVLVVFAIKNGAAWLVYRRQCYFMAGVASRISQQRLQKYLQGAYAQHVESDSAKHIRNIYFHPIEFCQHLLDGMQQFITQATLVLLAIVGILLFQAKLFLLLFLVLLPPMVIAFYYMKKRLASVREHTRTSSQQSLQYLQEALAGFVESNIYHKHDFFLRRYARSREAFHRYFAQFLVVQGTPVRIMEMFALLGLFMLVIISQWYGQPGAGTMATMGAFIAAAYRIIPGVVKMLNFAGQMHAYSYTLQEAHRPVMQQAPWPGKVQQASAQNGTIKAIEFSNVHFRYNGTPILQHFNLQLQPGDFAAITGASGKGKTTVLNLLLGFLAPDSGSILINNGWPATQQHHWHHIAYVKQQPFLLHDTILRNIVLDEKVYDEQKLQRVIKAAGLQELIGRDPQGLHKVIAENGRNISGGQRQRIALARALYKEADLIILDEPFNELDEMAENAFLRHFKALTEKGKMVVLITHNEKSLCYCNKKISLDA